VSRSDALIAASIRFHAGSGKAPHDLPAGSGKVIHKSYNFFHLPIPRRAATAKSASAARESSPPLEKPPPPPPQTAPAEPTASTFYQCKEECHDAKIIANIRLPPSSVVAKPTRPP